MSAAEYLYEERPRQQDGAPGLPNRDMASDSSLQSIVRRIRDCVELETNSIRTVSDFDAKQLNSRKSRLLYELGRASRNTDLADLDKACIDDFRALRVALAENETVLKSHMSAVTEVAGIVQKAIEREEADGTYTTAGFASQSAI